MALVDYTLDVNAAILSMKSGENRFNYPFAKSLNKGRDIIRKMKLETHKQTIALIEETVASLIAK